VTILQYKQWGSPCKTGFSDFMDPDKVAYKSTSVSGCPQLSVAHAAYARQRTTKCWHTSAISSLRPAVWAPLIEDLGGGSGLL
jgi:hypothetical protein